MDMVPCNQALRKVSMQLCIDEIEAIKQLKYSRFLCICSSIGLYVLQISNSRTFAAGKGPGAGEGEAYGWQFCTQYWPGKGIFLDRESFIPGIN